MASAPDHSKPRQRRGWLGEALRARARRWAAVLTGPVVLPATLLAVLALLLAHTSFEKRLAYDEPHHLAFGYRFLTEGPDIRDRERLPVVALSALTCLSDGCRPETLDRDEWRRLSARGPTMAFALGLGLLLYVWVREAVGLGAARLALVLYVFNPTVLAHGKQVTTDMATAFFTAACLYGAWCFVRGGGAKAFMAGVAGAAGAALSKYTALYLLALVPVLVLSCAWNRRAAVGFTMRRSARGIGLAALFVGSVLFLVNAAYQFSGTLTRSAQVPFESDAVRKLAKWDIPLPVPLGYARGFDYGVDVAATLNFGPNYVLGQRNRRGVWYAYSVMLLLKTPLAFFPLMGLALGWAREKRDSQVLRFWLAPALLHLAYFSLGVRVQIGIRYILPAVVLLIPVAAGAAARATRTTWIVVLGAWYAVSALSYLPHPMCYFNELIGRRIHSYRFLADSNLDWEDRSADIARYRARHPYRTIAIEPERLQPGYVLVGANRLVGIIDGEVYRPLRRLEPIDHIGYSFLLFNVRPGDLGPRNRPQTDAAPAR